MRRGVAFALLVMSSLVLAGCFGSDPPRERDPGWSEDVGLVVPEDRLADFPYDVRNFTVLRGDTGENYSERQWAVYDASYGGNCCEHYIATDEVGWIYNLGGEYPWWSEDRGFTWQEFQPTTLNQDTDCNEVKLTVQEGLGEGSIVQAPNGDMVAMSWFPYPDLDGTADRFYSFLYDKSEAQWRWCYNSLHEPFYDRSWQIAVPGPINPASAADQALYGQSGEYGSLVVSNWWSGTSNNGWQFSLDGLNYNRIDRPDPGDSLPSVEFPLDFPNPGAAYDYMTPHREIVAFPVPTGGVLFPGYMADGSNLFMDTELNWHSHTAPDGGLVPAPHLVIDSLGTLHSIERADRTLIHHMSSDGGVTWNSQNHSYAEADSSGTFEWDFQADGVHQLAVLFLRVQGTDGFDKDILFHIRDYHESLAADTITLIGQGDLDATSGAGNDVRFDFASLAILPDGGVVVAYADSTDGDPLFALELELPVGYLS